MKNKLTMSKSVSNIAFEYLNDRRHKWADSNDIILVFTQYNSDANSVSGHNYYSIYRISVTTMVYDNNNFKKYYDWKVEDLTEIINPNSYE